MTQGIRTSEFYVTIIAMALSFTAIYFGADAGVIGAANSSAIAYIGGRSYAKRGAS